ncbi:TonB-dependent siderophore receptor [Ideonella azotifigens]|uniref:TonB-dependent siderophore receptor n=1 Tax=Ideonella azotifigens TaxID=513160 RepID=A0ABP3UZX1_9BURK|nr:TonB-dependent siderophore receptor [Ideonella azotifigens]MCD2340917.1 TonB-dependent siderophore receptor [Ideonella azotifigens]
MARRLSSSFLRLPLAAAALLALTAGAHAQTTPTEVVTVTGRSSALPATIAGFGDTPLARSPFQASVLNTGLLLDSGIDSLGEITKLDASIGDAYNAPGYWASMRVRGYELDNRHNYRRDGLPINAETAPLMDNKESIEVLKGTSGAQAGISSPAGLVNFVVKRPRGDQKSVLLGWTESGSLKAAADIDQQLLDGQAGLRINASVEKLDPLQHDTEGHRHLLAAAGMLSLGSGGKLEAEVEFSHQSQPSVPGYSMLGDTLPKASTVDPRLNLNNQPWSLPVVFDGQTASLRWTQALSAQWQLSAQAMLQRLQTDDRAAFPVGLFDPVTYDCAPCDRYSADGHVSLWDFRSENEHRDTRTAALTLEGKLATGPLTHQLSTGLTWSKLTARFGPQTYNLAGTGTVDGKTEVPASPEALYTNTNRDERSVELHLRDVLDLSQATRLWLGLRHTRLSRGSVATDGSEPVSYDQSFTTPWLALTQQFTPTLMGYASWGQGIESDVAPNRPVYSNAGQPLPALKSRQTEVGVKFQDRELDASLTAFDIHRPVSSDLGSCSDDGSCTRVSAGDARHRGLEASVDWHGGPLTLRGSAMALRARREGAADAAQNGLVPENVAQRSLRATAIYAPPQVPGLSLVLTASHEGSRYVLPDNSVAIPGWTTWSLASRYQTRIAGHDTVLRVGVDNLFDQRAWQESPYQYGHVYLYPVAPRTFRASFQAFL